MTRATIGTDSRAPRGKWSRPRPAAVVQELVSHALLLGFAWFGGLGYLGIVLVFIAEALLIISLSIVLFPQRGLRRHLLDMVKAAGLSALLLFFLVVTYGSSHGSGPIDGATVRSALDVDLLGATLGFTAAHMGVMLLYARSTPEPRKTWARLALTQGAVTFLALFFLVFVAAFLGPVAVQLARSVAPQVAVGDVLALLAVLVRLALALMMAHIPEHELDRIAQNPYVD